MDREPRSIGLASMFMIILLVGIILHVFIFDLVISPETPGGGGTFSKVFYYLAIFWFADCIFFFIHPTKAVYLPITGMIYSAAVYYLIPLLWDLAAGETVNSVNLMLLISWGIYYLSFASFFTYNATIYFRSKGF